MEKKQMQERGIWFVLGMEYRQAGKPYSKILSQDVTAEQRAQWEAGWLAEDHILRFGDDSDVE